MKVKIITEDLDSTAKTLCFNARSIQKGLFSPGGFLVLPYLASGVANSVYFPDLNYTHRFWSELARQKNYSLTSPIWNTSLDEIKDRLVSYSFPDTSALVLDWSEKYPAYISTLGQVFSPSSLSQIKEANLIFTEFGTRGTFARVLNSDKTYSIIFTSRIDFPVEQAYEVLTQAIILCTQFGENDIGTSGWLKRNGIIEFLKSASPLLPYISWTASGSVTPKLLVDSEKYLYRLGFPDGHQLDLSQFIGTLPLLEGRLLTILYQNRGVLVSFEDLASAVWQDEIDEKYSLYALSKLIERLRRKIRASGINKEVIHTFRKKGYLLAD